MAEHANSVEDYGWRSPERAQHTGYNTPRIFELLKKLKVNRLLDLGSGNGSLCNDLSRSGFEVVGVELDSKGVEIARQNFPGVTFYKPGSAGQPT